MTLSDRGQGMTVNPRKIFKTLRTFSKVVFLEHTQST